MKRIFSLVLALLLIVTMVPMNSVEAEAFLTEVGAKYQIVYNPGRGKGELQPTSFVDLDASGYLATAASCGFYYTGYTFGGWQIGSTVYAEGDIYTFSKSDAVFDNDTNQYKVHATAIWSKNDGSGKETITVTYNSGEAKDGSFSKSYVKNEPFYFAECTFEYPGYDFVGWLVAGYDEPFGTDQQVSSSVSLSVTAIWEKAKVVIGETVDSISIKDKPKKTTYKVGEKLDLTGLSLSVVKSGSTSTVTSGFTTSVRDGEELKIAGTYTITVTYKDKTASFTIEVKSESSSSSRSSTSSSKSSSASSSKTSSSSKSSSASSSAPSSSVPSSSEPETSSAPESSVPETPETDVFEPISLAFSISGDIPVTKIEFVLNEDIGENPQLSVAALDTYSVTDKAASKFIADGDALAAFDLSLLVAGTAYNGNSLGTVTYSLNGTQANAVSNYDSYVLAMVHTTGLEKYNGAYYMPDGDATYIYDPATSFKNAVENVVLEEEDGINRLVIIDPTGLSSFAYLAAENLIVEVKLVPSASAAAASIDVTTLSPVLLVQLEVGEAKAAGIPLWVIIVVAVLGVLFLALVVLFIVNRSNEKKHSDARRGATRPARKSVSSGITGFDDDDE